MKMAQDMLKNMSPDQVQKLMAEAKEAQKTMKDQVAEAVREEIERQGLITRADVEKLIAERLLKSS